MRATHIKCMLFVVLNVSLVKLQTERTNSNYSFLPLLLCSYISETLAIVIIDLTVKMSGCQVKINDIQTV